MNGIRKASESGTAVVGIASLLIYVGSAYVNHPIPWEIVASVVGGYAVKEGARHFSSATPTAKQVKK